MKFSSKIQLHLKSGAGGDGIISWYRESRNAYGGPAGGNGGNGGSIYFVAEKNLNSLFHLHSKKIFSAKAGKNGGNNGKHGKKGENLFIYVPCGTNIYDSETSEKITELIYDKQEFLICVGGKGGKGNMAFKNSEKPTPFMYEKGDYPEEKKIILDLECIADIGFLGFPNSGKSTLLSNISNAKPKIASFPFTTVIPVLGSVNYKNQTAVFADIPGLIEGASQGLGLGFEFLKHLNRCKVLVHIVDGVELNIVKNILLIENELKIYSSTLFQKPKILVINKSDLLTDEQIKKISKNLDDLNIYEKIFISAKSKINLEVLLDKTFALLNKFLNDAVDEKKSEEIEYMEFNDGILDNNEILDIIKKNDIWEVENLKLKYWIHKIPATTNDNSLRLKNKLDFFEIDKKLINAGVKKGDIVRIYGFNYSFI